MPLYEYRCTACDHQFEVIQKFSDAPISVCPKCSGGPVEKLLSSPAFQFKGTGWYVTDYARKDQGKSSDKDKSADKEKSSDKESSDKDKSSEKDKSSDKDKPAARSGGSSASDSASSSAPSSSSPPNKTS